MLRPPEAFRAAHVARQASQAGISPLVAVLRLHSSGVLSELAKRSAKGQRHSPAQRMLADRSPQHRLRNGQARLQPRSFSQKPRAQHPLGYSQLAEIKKQLRAG